MMSASTAFYSFIIAVFLTLQGCSSSTFHLRKSVDLPKDYQQLQIENAPDDNDFAKVFKTSLEESDGRIADKAKTKITLSRFREGKRVVAYDKDRKARIYLIFVKFEYEVKGAGGVLLEKRRINLDRTFVYDANYALGKAEEEDQILHDLYVEAARLILLRLQYSKNS